MKKKGIIIDLDNTIYPVQSIGKELFASLFELIDKGYNYPEKMQEIKKEIMRRPFQMVASDYGFSKELTREGIELLNEMEYKGKIEPFDDYRFLKELQINKFLVTTGFLKLQQSKIEGMKIGNDFKEIHIVDPARSSQSKKDVFRNIMITHDYDKSELLVVGDDMNSEIQAAIQLGIDALLYDKNNRGRTDHSIPVISDFSELNKFIFS